MAVYEGARPRPVLAPRTGLGRRVAGPAEAPAVARRRVRGAVRARRHSNRVGIILGAIVIAFLLAFFSLAQSMRVSATGYRIDSLAAQHDQLSAQEHELVSDLNRLGREPAIRKEALTLGLGQLDQPLVLQAR